MQDIEAPALWGMSPSKEPEVINYRRYKNFYIVDHLIDLVEIFVSQMAMSKLVLKEMEHNKSTTLKKTQ